MAEMKNKEDKSKAELEEILASKAELEEALKPLNFLKKPTKLSLVTR